MEGDRPVPAHAMEPLAVLPVFFKLGGRSVVMAGGSPAAAWKAELLAAAGAQVRVYAEEPGPELTDLASRSAPVVLIGRRWAPDDIRGAALAVGAIDNDDEAAAFRTAAHAVGVPVNVIDRPDFCDFQFGTIVARSPLVIGISTDGAAPVLGQAIRTRLEALLPQSLRAWAEAAKAWRPAVQTRNFGFHARRRFWQTFAERALDHADAPSPRDQDACFAAAEQDHAIVTGRIDLVGSGSGARGNLTLDSVRVLQGADVVLYDAEVSGGAVSMARREAEKRPVGDEHAARALALELTRQGRRVAWLGVGDPKSCSQWTERFAALSREELVVAAVPGLRRREPQ